VRRIVEEGPSFRAEVRALRAEKVERWRRDRAAILAGIDAQLHVLRPPPDGSR
jgi:hypothetical protein